MRRTFRVALALSIVASTLSTVSIQTVNAVSANPSAVCSGATCTVTFTFTGDFYTWTVPYTARYTLEVWGSQGGSAGYNGTVLQAGGAGGYAKGNIDLIASNSISIYVGGRGAGLSGTSTLVSPAGGWNGGGAGYIGSSTSAYRGSGGGGATDIRVGGSALSNRVIVAGAGAGGVRYSGYGTNYPGVGGGLSGGDGSTANYGTSQPYNGKGGTQSAGGVKGTNCGGGSNGTSGVGGASEVRDGYGGGGGGGGYFGGGGGGCGMGAGGGSGYVGGVLSSTLTAGNASMPNPSGGTVTGRTGDGVARITYDNTISATTFSTTQTSPTNTSTATTVTYSLILSQSVSDLTASDFQFGGTSTCNSPGLSGSTTAYTVTVTNCTEGTLILQLKANSVTGTVSGPASISSANTVVIDRTAPTIGTLIAPANKTYIPSETATFTVPFSESVTITGAPRLTLTVGTQTRFATYLSMTDSRTALFRYTVASNPTDFDTDGISISTTLDLNGGTIRDLATNNLAPETFTAPTLTSVLVAQPPAAPTIDSITATSGTLTVFFTPGATRGSTTSNYQFSLNNGTWTTRASGTTASPLAIGSLVNGTGYAVRLRAVTNAGNSDPSTAVTETPTAVSVTGDSTLTLTHGNSSSTGAYSATGGTNSYDWTLGSTLTGITLSGTTVTAGPTTPAGTYSQTVRATDGNSQVGTRSLTITVAKAATSITIALPNAATNAALGGAVTITATVPRAGAVNFRLGGATLAGCGAAAAASTTATCSWTPLALGSVALTAIFTPTDMSNFETSTTTTLTITVVNGVSTVSLSLAGGVTQVPKGKAINIVAAIDQVGRITFLIDGKRIPGCFNLVASVIGNRSCSWKPAVQKRVNITARLVPTNNVFNPSVSSLAVQVVRRTGARSVGGGGIPSI